MQQMNFRPPNFNNQSSPSLFNKPIRFNINKHGTKINPMMRHQQLFGNNFNPQNSPSLMNNQFQNSNSKKRKNKKKNKANNNNVNNNSFNNPSQAPPLPPIDFQRPPPPIGPLKPAQNVFTSNSDSSLASNEDKSEIPSPSSSASESTPANPTMEWPESLYNYVARCYMKCLSPLDKDLCEITLKGKITMAANRGELFTKDWDNEAMPILHSERQQQPQNKSPANNLFNKNKNVVTGHLAQYQNQNQSRNTGKSPLRKRKSSSSRSRSSSPSKKYRSSDEDEKYSKNISFTSKSSKKRAKKGECRRKKKLKNKLNFFPQQVRLRHFTQNTVLLELLNLTWPIPIVLRSELTDSNR